MNDLEKVLLGKGLVAYRQSSMGLAYVVGKTQEPFQPGQIIVARETNLDMMSYLLQAGGIVTEIGGRLCHAAIVARERKISCIVGVDGIYDLVLCNYKLELDSVTGEVFKIG